MTESRDLDVFFCRNCGEGIEALNVQDAAERHATVKHEFEVMAQIEDDVIDPEGETATVTQIIEDGEVALVEYADGSEGEWDLVDLLVRPTEDTESY